jgi:hypothetical protein
MTNIARWALRYRVETRSGDRDDVWRDILGCPVRLVPVRTAS